ncbi:MAG: UDP-N-acetylmuramoyl-L-alanyl-D-glutamate--2,6-diaminopimelate ligase [Firmicutes bacterium]|nr:UDP-N-acetylmuramoyl-L-alanyl-D-glutamate--2,6-diaminopimelate ligase [Bacillota bacterium]
MLLSKLLADLPLTLPAKDLAVTGIAYDSRRVERGFLFVAVKGFQTDGHLYIQDAVNRGAAAIVMQQDLPVPEDVVKILAPDTRRLLPQLSARFFDYPARKMKMIGVTGTNGKTTTTNLIESIYRAHGAKTGLIGTIHNRIGSRLLPVEHTTPESTDLQILLAEMAGAGVESVTMEVSSHALALHRVDQCEFDTAVFTNLTQDHLDFHGSMDDYLAAKLILFEQLGRETNKTGPKWAVVNADDPAAKRVKAACSAPVITYGIKRPADIAARNLKLSAQGVYFTALIREEAIPMHLKLTARFNVYNALAAIGAGVAAGIPPAIIKMALEGVAGVPGRFELVDRGQPFAVVVDYAHTPDGLKNVLATAREVAKGKVIAVFGCGGDRDRTKRQLMGEIAVRLSSLAVITSDNPRSENPLNIINDIMTGVQKAPGALYQVIPDRRQAIDWAIRTAKTGDVVVIAGKGHEDYQIIGDLRMHFDDREVAAAILDNIVNGEHAG